MNLLAQLPSTVHHAGFVAVLALVNSLLTKGTALCHGSWSQLYKSILAIVRLH